MNALLKTYAKEIEYNPRLVTRIGDLKNRNTTVYDAIERLEYDIIATRNVMKHDANYNETWVVI
jgi:hypothetical protein